MAKKGTGNSNKVSFGKRKTGKLNGKKAYGPKEQKPKPYVSQGR
jgi:hypothetical protein